MSQSIFVHKVGTKEYGVYAPGLSEATIKNIALDFGLDILKPDGSVDFSKAQEMTLGTIPVPPPIPPPSSIPSDGATNFLVGASLYTDSFSQLVKFLASNPNDPNIKLLTKLDQPTGIWLTGGTPEQVNSQVKSVLKNATGELVTFVVYNIPHRDNGGASSGGAANQDAYEAWIGAIDAAVNDSGNPKVVFIMEPDAIGFASQTQDYAQYEAIQIATDILTQHPNRSVYLDIAMWDSKPDNMITAINFLKTADHLKNVRGWALNTSGYNLDSVCKTFGEALVKAVGGHYIVDTSRNAKGGVAGQWENVPGQGLGAVPLSQPATATFDGNLWIKPPSESDGPNNGNPSAGQFNYNYSVELAKNS